MYIHNTHTHARTHARTPIYAPVSPRSPTQIHITVSKLSIFSTTTEQTESLFSNKSHKRLCRNCTGVGPDWGLADTGKWPFRDPKGGGEGQVGDAENKTKVRVRRAKKKKKEKKKSHIETEKG